MSTSTTLTPDLLVTGVDPLPMGYARGYAGTMQAMRGAPGDAVWATTTELLDALVHDVEQLVVGWQLGRLAALATHDEGLLAALDHLDAGTAQRHLLLWTTLVRTGRGLVCHAPLVVTGTAAWLMGDRALAAHAQQRAAGLADGHWATTLLTAALDHQPGDERWGRLRESAAERVRQDQR